MERRWWKRSFGQRNGIRSCISVWIQAEGGLPEALYLTYFEVSCRQAAEIMGKSEKQIAIWYTGESASAWIAGAGGNYQCEVMNGSRSKTSYCGKRIQKKTAERMGCSSLLRGRISCSDHRCVSLSMPDTVSRIEMGTSSGFETAATMLGGSTALGYIVVGLLALFSACA